MDEALVQISDVHKVYPRGAERVDVLKGLDLAVPRGEFLALMGPSGSGKTTLLNLIGGLDTPTSGRVVVGDRDLTRASSRELARWRAQGRGPASGPRGRPAAGLRRPWGALWARLASLWRKQLDDDTLRLRGLRLRALLQMADGAPRGLPQGDKVTRTQRAPQGDKDRPLIPSPPHPLTRSPAGDAAALRAYTKEVQSLISELQEWAPRLLEGEALINFLVDNLLRPILVGKSTRIPDYVVLVSTLGGLSLFGVNGFVIGPAIAAMFIAAWDIFARSRDDLNPPTAAPDRPADER